jgi:hypothetical protein
MVLAAKAQNRSNVRCSQHNCCANKQGGCGHLSFRFGVILNEVKDLTKMADILWL